eukprot:3099752-Prymnesium_polylepis.2
MQNIALLGPAVVGICMLCSVLSSGGQELYTPHGAGLGVTLAVQASWLLIGFAASPAQRPAAVAYVRCTISRAIQSTGVGIAPNAAA